MNKTQALKTARAAVTQPFKQGHTSWVVYGPYDAANLAGPSTEMRAGSFWSARAKRAEWVVYIALILMGASREDADRASSITQRTRIEEMLDDCLRHLPDPLDSDD